MNADMAALAIIRAPLLPPGNGANAAISTLSCASAGNCSAGGYYRACSGYEAFVVNEANGI
jgi:hypothetical protein